MIAFADLAAGPPIYQIKITLDGSDPKIWRRFLARSDMKLDRFHRLIQLVMGWTNSHLHQFVMKGDGKDVFIGIPDPDFLPGWSNEVLHEKKYTVASLLFRVKQKVRYEYDFGDGWRHELLLEKILPPDSAFKHPICLAGANACPPEDCGGIWGYYERFLLALKDPEHEDHEMYTEWIGGSWDPERFDVEEVNGVLRRLKA